VVSTGLSPVTRLYNSRTADFVWMATDSDVSLALTNGYVKQSIDFYAPTASSSCTVGVHRFVKGTHHRNAWTTDEQEALVTAGWTDSGVGFYMRQSTGTPVASVPAPTPTATTATPTPAPTATVTTPAPTASATTPAPTVTATSSGSDTFTLGVIGDTQDEIYSSSDARFPRRTAWLAANKDKLGIKYVLQTGDLGSWAWLATNQYDNAKNAMSNLNTAGIPYTIAIGNHDTEAVGWDGVAGSSGLGGSAFAYSPMCPSKVGAANCNSNWLVRQTGPFNSYFPASSVKNVGGAYEAGKADNIWTTFTANNTKWLVLTLELWQRPAVVAWAKDVVATHPDYNVIISTHSYLDGGGTISTSNGGYGATAPSYLYDQVVSKYSNVKMVFSGHVGTTATRTDTPNGNTVVSYLGNELGQDAAFRVLTINTKTGTVTSTVYNGALTSVGTTNNSIKIIS